MALQPTLIGSLGALVRCTGALALGEFGSRLVLLALAPYLELRYRFVTFSASGTITQSEWTLDLYYRGLAGSFLLGGTVTTSPWNDGMVGQATSGVVLTASSQHRVAIGLRTSTHLSGTGLGAVYAADGEIWCWIDDTEVLHLSGLTIPVRSIDDPPMVVYGCVVTVDRAWARPSTSAPTTTSLGAWVTDPGDLYLYDDFSTSDLSAWTAVKPQPGAIAPSGVYPYWVADAGASLGGGLCFQSVASIVPALPAPGTTVWQGVRRSVGTFVPPPGPPVLPAACPVDFTPTPATGGAACAARVLP